MNQRDRRAGASPSQQRTDLAAPGPGKRTLTQDLPTGVPGGAPAATASRGGGAALPRLVLDKMNRSFGADFSAVRIHEGPEAAAVGALAYTQGTDIFFAPGQYAPDTVQGQELLGHELAHTVQQAQGRVQATGHAKGQALNADPGLEQEAEAMGARAARGESAHGGEAASSAEPVAGAPVVAQRAVIQRAVGFEFETGWFVDRVPFDHDHDDVEQPNQAPVPFAKKDVVSNASFDGFRMEADEAEGGRSEIEFVVRPPVEESKAGLGRITTIMAGMQQVGERLKAHYNGNDQPFPLSRVTGASFDEFTLVTPRAGDPDLKAGPQVTMGLDLAAIPELTRPQHAPVPPRGEHPKFDGFVALIKQYVTRGTGDGGALSYPKILAEPLLARTNFVKLFQLVEPEIQHRYMHAKDTWVRDVLTLAGLPTSLADQDILGRGVVSDDDQDRHLELRLEISSTSDDIRHLQHQIDQLDIEIDQLAQRSAHYQPPKGMLEKFNRRNEPDKQQLDHELSQKVTAKLGPVGDRAALEEHKARLVLQKRQLETYAGFTVGRWLRELLDGVDLLPTIKDAESLGEFGARTEQVGPGKDIEGGIFEWRGDQTTKIPVTAWPGYAQGYFAKLLKLHGHED